jgi:hypothetical protein
VLPSSVSKGRPSNGKQSSDSTYILTRPPALERLVSIQNIGFVIQTVKWPKLKLRITGTSNLFQTYVHSTRILLGRKSVMTPLHHTE